MVEILSLLENLSINLKSYDSDKSKAAYFIKGILERLLVKQYCDNTEYAFTDKNEERVFGKLLFEKEVLGDLRGNILSKEISEIMRDLMPETAKLNSWKELDAKSLSAFKEMLANSSDFNHRSALLEIMLITGLAAAPAIAKDVNHANKAKKQTLSVPGTSDIFKAA